MSRRRALIAVPLAALMGILALGSPAQAAAGPLKPVAAVDISRYAGSWYQVAAIPQIFEAQCAGDVTATYTPNADQTVQVRNVCRTYWGSTSTVNGRARSENAPANSTLTVSFLKIAGQWLYFGGPNYVIIGLDSDYRWAVVGDPSRRSGFVLSRTPSLPAADLAAAKAALVSNGYDLCDFKQTPQAGTSNTGTLC